MCLRHRFGLISQRSQTKTFLLRSKAFRPVSPAVTSIAQVHSVTSLYDHGEEMDVKEEILVDGVADEAQVDRI